MLRASSIENIRNYVYLAKNDANEKEKIDRLIMIHFKLTCSSI